MKVLWLCSWYPNPVNPYDGDFIQRHAKATTVYMPITVFYVAQLGEKVNVTEDKALDLREGDLKEQIIFFRFRKTGLKWIDKILYNTRYYRIYKNAIKKYIEKEGKPDLVHVHVPMKAGVIAGWMRKKWGIPYIVSEQSSMYSRTAPNNFYRKNSFHRSRVKEIFKNAVAVTNVSATVGKTLKDIFGLPVVKVIHNTVNTDYFNYKETKTNKFRFVHVSTLTHQKNIEGMLRAISHLAALRQDFEVVIVGPVKEQLKQIADKEGLQSIVSFTGEISYRQVASQMQQASAFLMFSRHENFPCVMVEALSCGLPFIGTDVGGVAEAIDDSNGMIVASENEDELSGAMNRMMDEYRKFNREKIAATAQQKFGYGAIGKQFYELYQATELKRAAE